MKLYKVYTKDLGEFYTIANDPTHASNIVYDKLTKEDYGFYDSRKVIRIDLVAESQKDSSYWGTCYRLVLEND